MGLRLSPDKTLITHIEGLDFLGWRIQRHRKRGSDRRYEGYSKPQFIEKKNSPRAESYESR
jgi:hypothetical protein